MKYRLTPKLNDGLRESPSIDVDSYQLLRIIREELANDNGTLFKHPFTLLIEALP